MVCSKCQNKIKQTELATPGVKHRNEIYYGSPTTSIANSRDKSKTSATIGATGVGKVTTSAFLGECNVSCANLRHPRVNY